MTEEEKKEFEEFLQWKAEKKRKEEQKESEAKIDLESQSTESSKNDLSTNKMSIKDEPQKSDSDVNYKLLFIVGGTIIALLLILMQLIIQRSHQVAEKQKQEKIQDSITAEKKKAIALQQAKEKAVKDSIWRVERIQTLKKSVKITTARLSSPNSASGCSATVYYKNLSNKTIKYFTWVGHCINAVGDRVSCEIRGDDEYRGRDTGPVRPGKSSGGNWDCIIYNWSAKKLIITEVEIEYTDGSYLNISQNEMKYIR